MIKAEVFFDGDAVVCGEYRVIIDFENLVLFISKNGVFIGDFETLEKAVTYCEESRK